MLLLKIFLRLKRKVYIDRFSLETRSRKTIFNPKQNTFIEGDLKSGNSKIVTDKRCLTSTFFSKLKSVCSHGCSISSETQIFIRTLDDYYIV